MTWRCLFFGHTDELCFEAPGRLRERCTQCHRKTDGWEWEIATQHRARVLRFKRRMAA